MVLIPQNTKTTQYQIESKLIFQEPRSYLGMSGIGHSCSRAIWYGWRWATLKPLTTRMHRLFNRGHLEEASVITDLKKIGIEVFRVDEDGNEFPMTGEVGEEQEELVGFHRHSMGHPDGRVRGVIEAPKKVHTLEMKTMNDKNYNILLEQGVKKGFPGYFDQMTMYMGRMGLTRALFVATNKNDQSRKYIRVKFEKKRFERLVEKEESIVLSELPPPKAYKPDHYICGWCGHYQMCHLGKTPEMNCRTCKHGDIMPKGKWSCGLTGKRISKKRQLKGCTKYERLF